MDTINKLKVQAQADEAAGKGKTLQTADRDAKGRRLKDLTPEQRAENRRDADARMRSGGNGDGKIHALATKIFPQNFGGGTVNL